MELDPWELQFCKAENLLLQQHEPDERNDKYEQHVNLHEARKMAKQKIVPVDSQRDFEHVDNQWEEGYIFLDYNYQLAYQPTGEQEN